MKLSRAGMTLIEVLLSSAILATLATLTARSIQQAVRAKIKIQGQIDDVSRMRDALRLMEKDINLAYHHRDFEQELADTVKKLTATTTTATGGPGGAAPVDPAAEPQPEASREVPRRDPATHFVGAGESFSFVTMNNARVLKDSRQADFMEVGYTLKDCRSVDGKTTSKCLWRRSSHVVNADVTTGGDEVVLLEHVSEFSVKYIGKGKQDWVQDWRTDRGGDASTRLRFPQAVQISLSVKKGDGDAAKKYSMQIVATVHFPNNKEEENAASPGSRSANDPP